MTLKRRCIQYKCTIIHYNYVTQGGGRGGAGRGGGAGEGYKVPGVARPPRFV